ncbi:MAG: carboxypeptidase regulatory-like domain-containing protein [Aureispira sp.]|nr:carboxypeptidase regulatory-like domain-containing protein [Aureispira sp.]
MRKISLISILFFLLCGSSLSVAQGWQKTLIDDRVWPAIWAISSEGQGVQETPDGGFLVVGEDGPLQQSVSGSLILTKLDANGTIQWEKQDTTKTLFGAVEDYRYSDLLKTNDGHYLAAGYLRRNCSIFACKDIIFAKLDVLGDTIWTKIHDIGFEEQLGGVANTADGGFVFTINNNDTSSICKIDAQGALLWSKIFSISPHQQFKGVIETSTGEFVTVGDMAAIAKTDANGNLLWINTNNNTLVGTGGATTCLTEMPDGSYVIAGYGSGVVGYFPLIFKADTSGTPDLNWINIGGFNAFGIAAMTSVETTSNGGIVFTGSGPHSGGVLTTTTVLNSADNTQGYRVKETSDGGFIVVGNNHSGVYVAKTDSSLVFPYNTIRGNVYNDVNTDCNKDTSDTPLSNWIVKITNTSLVGGSTIYATADTAGNYTAQVDTGTYSVEIHNTNPYWQTCQAAQMISFPQYYQDTIIDFGMQHLINCPLLQVDLSTPFLRRCFSSNYYV